MEERRRILVAEDEFLIAMDLKEMLDRLGYETSVVGSLDEAVSVATHETFAAAIIDYDLHGKTTDQVVAALEKRGIPFMIASGMNREDIHLIDTELLLEKPYTVEGVEIALGTLITAGEVAHAA